MLMAVLIDPKWTYLLLAVFSDITFVTGILFLVYTCISASGINQYSEDFITKSSKLHFSQELTNFHNCRKFSAELGLRSHDIITMHVQSEIGCFSVPHGMNSLSRLSYYRQMRGSVLLTIGESVMANLDHVSAQSKFSQSYTTLNHL